MYPGCCGRAWTGSCGLFSIVPVVVSGRKLQNFAWSLTAAPAGSLAQLDDSGLVKPSFTADLAGDYVFELVVSQANRSSDPDEVVISTVNSLPRADAGHDQAITLGQILQLDASGSSDVDGDALTYSWSLTQLPAGSGASLSDTAAVRPTVFIDTAGDYIAALTVNDGTGNSEASQVRFSTDNVAPRADAGADRRGVVGETLILAPNASGDADGEDAAFDWALIARPSGSSASLANSNRPRPSFTVDQPGTYIVQLVLDDGPLESVADTLAFDTTNTPPKAAAGGSLSIDGQRVTPLRC